MVAAGPAELEPGIIDAYEGEDRLADEMRFMDSTGFFWMSDLSIQGSHRIDAEIAAVELAPVRAVVTCGSRQTRTWMGEVEHFNDSQGESLGTREYLLGYVFAAIRGHDAFALELAVHARKRFGNPRSDVLKSAAWRRVRSRRVKLPYSAARERLRLRTGS